MCAAAARALLEGGNADLTAEQIVRKSMQIAGDMCVYTNHNLIVENIFANSITTANSSNSTASASSTSDDKKIV